MKIISLGNTVSEFFVEIIRLKKIGDGPRSEVKGRGFGENRSQ